MPFDPVALRFLLIWSVFLAGSAVTLLVVGRVRKQSLVSRLLTWIPIFVLLFGAIFAGRWGFFILIVALFFLSHWELARLASKSGLLRHAFALGLALPWLILMQFHHVPVGVFLSLVLFSGLLIYLALFLKQQHQWRIVPLAMMLGVGFSFWILLGKAGGFRLVLFVFSVTAFNDMMAFFFGMIWGGRKPFPRLSPNKTLAGYLGGCLSAVVAAHVFRFAVPELGSVAVTVAGILLAIAGSLGDLLASKIKRVHNVKDFGSLMGVMGGVFDRCDSLLPSAWVFAILFLYFI